MDERNYRLGLIALTAIVALVAATQGAEVGSDFFCDSGSLGGECTVTDNKTLDEGDIVSGNDLVLDAKINSSGKYTLNFSGEIDFQTDAMLKGTADVFSNNTLNRENLRLEAGSPGNFLICERYGNVNCTLESDAGTSIDANYSLESGRAIFREIESDWNKGILNWTEDAALTTQLDNSFDNLTADYRIKKLKESTDFQILENGSTQTIQNSGILPEFITDKEFTGGNSANLSTGETLKLKVKGEKSSQIGGTTAYEPNRWDEAGITSFNSDFLVVNGIYLYSETNQTTRYELYEGGQTSNILKGSYEHNGTGWELATVSDTKLEDPSSKNTNYYLAVRHEKKKYNGGSYGTVNGIKWEELTDRYNAAPSPWNMGLKVSQGYESSGYYNSSTKDAGEEVEWVEKNLKASFPDNTSYSLTYWTNNSGSGWTEYQNIADIPDSRYLRYYLELETTDNFVTPEVDEFELGYNPPGPDGSINFTATLNETSKNFVVRELSAPTSSNLQQESDLIGAPQSNNLSALLEDTGSGIAEAILATNETGTLENRSGYNKNYELPASTTSYFIWKNESIETVEDIKWQIWFRDASGNWNSTATSTFKLDGKGPQFSDITYPQYFDVDSGSKEVSVTITDEIGSVDTAVFEEENRDGTFNSTPNKAADNYSAILGSYDTPQKVNFTFYANDTLENWNSVSRTVNFQNISISQSLSSQKVNSSDSFTVSGNLELKPDNTAVTSETVEVWTYTDTWTKKTETTTDGNGDFSSQISIDRAGTHEVKVNSTNENGISGESSRKIDVSLDITSESSVFNHSGNSHADVDRDDRVVNLTAEVSEPVDTSVSSVQAEIETPEGDTRTFGMTRGDGRTWFNEANTTAEFGDLEGEYTVTYSAETGSGIKSNYPQSRFYIENISVNSTITDLNVSIGEETTISGKAWLEPYEDFQDYGNVTVEVEDRGISNFSLNSGEYTGQIKTGEPGNKTVNITYENQDGIKGQNTTYFYAYNLSARIENVEILGEGQKLDVYRDNDSSDAEVQFHDNVTADSENSFSNYEVALNYERPPLWSATSTNINLGTLAPGESKENSPKFDIGNNAELGSHQINISTSSREEIVSRDSTTVEVWSESESNYLNLDADQSLNRKKSFYNVSAKVVDVYSGNTIEGINTSIYVGGYGRLASDVSNESGIVELPINLSLIGTGSDFTASVKTHDNESKYINSSEAIFGENTTRSFSVEGQMQRGQEDEITPVYRKNDVTGILGEIQDSTGDALPNVTTYLSINGTVYGPKETGNQYDSDLFGYYQYSYDAPDSIVPGLYNATINASKDQFAPFEFNRTVEIRGKLGINNLVERDIIQRGKAFNANSHVEDEFNEKTYGNVSWYLNSTDLGQGENASLSVPKSLERGKYELEASTARKFYDDDSSVKDVEVYGLASVDLKPDDFTIKPGNTVTLEATVEDANTSDRIENYPVKFSIDGTEYTRMTNSTGVATYDWSVSTGNYEVSATIDDNSSLNYNASEVSDTTEVEVRDKLYLDEYEFSNKDIYRYFRTPYRAVFNINLTRNSDTVNRVPVANEEVEFTINGTHTISCITDSTGACGDDLIYDPGSEVSAGNLTVRANTDRPDSVDVNETNNLIVRGQLQTTLESPSAGSNLARGDTVQLEAMTDTLVGGEVKRNLTWSINGRTIEPRGYDTSWEVPFTEETGQATLTAKGDGEFFASDSDGVNVWILGNAEARLDSPDNSSAIGYDEPVQVRCEARSQGATINDYPVEFVENSSGSYEVFATKQTEDTGDEYQATASWQPPEQVTKVDMGCRIEDNRTVGYRAETHLDTKVFQTLDDVPPDITNVDVPEGVNPDSQANITFNASDEEGLQDVKVTVTTPALTKDYPEVNEKTGTGYKSIYDTTGRANGDYEVDIKVTDNSGNTVTVKDSFSIRPGGEIKVDKEDIVARNITQSKSHSESIEASLKVDETANNADINLVLDDSDVLSANTTGYNCGDLESGDYCNRSFKVTVPSGASPTLGSSLYATVRGNWKNPDKAKETTVSDFTAINIKKNPRMKELRGNYSFPIPHGDLASIDFKPESFGNSPVKDYRAVFRENTLNRSWVTITNGEEASIGPGDTITTDYDISIPTGTAATTYSSQVDLLTSNSDNVTREISVTVPPDRTYSVPDSLTASAVKGINGTLVEFQVNSTGNVDLNLGYRGRNTDATKPCAQNILEGDEHLEKQGTAMIEVKYDLEGVDFTGECAPNIEIDPDNGDEVYETPIPDSFKKNVTVNIDVVKFKVTPSQKSYSGMPGDNKSLSFDALLGGSPVSQSNIDYQIRVNDEMAEIVDSNAFGNGTFNLNYSIPQVPDGRTHNVEVIVEQTSKGIERTKNAGTVSVPDITPPQFQFFDIQGVDPNKTQEIEVPVSDNSGTVENVSMRLEGPQNVSNYSLEKVTGQEKWSVSIPDAEKGVYRANFTAFDSSGYSSSVVDTFRVSSNTTFDGSFTTPDGGANSGADLVFRDSDTNQSIPASIDNNGGYSVDLKEGNYDVTAEFDNQQVRLQNTPVDENTSGFRAEKLTEVETSGLTPADSTDARVMGIGVDTGLEPESATITFNYSEADIPSGYSLSELELARCPDYNYGSLTCDSSSFETFEVGRLDVNKAKKTITVDVSGFSSYTLFAPAEGSKESDEPDQPDDSGGGGGGGGALGDAFEDLNESVSETQEEVENLSERLNDTETPGAELGSSSINAELRPGEQKTVSLSVSNTANDSQTFVFGVDEIISDYVSMSDTATLESGESRDVLLNISAPADELAGSYSGTLSIESDEINTNIPVNVQVLPPQDKLLDMSLNPVFSSVEPGDALQVEATFSNQGYARNVDVTAVIDVLDPDTNETIASLEETVAVGTTLNRVVEIDIPEDTQLKSYAIRGSARYTNLDVARVATAASSFEVDQPFWSRDIFGFTYGNIALGFILILLVSAIGFSIYYYRRKQALKKKRYMENIDLDTIPSGGDNQAYLGELAEVGTRTFSQLDDLTTHALIAGATGSGKTVTGQVMVEEALENGANVIVLDPTAQWTGYLRQNKDQNMLDLYDNYGMRQSDARAFDGNIRAVEPEEDIDITPYLEQDEDGQIIIFSLHKLDSKNIDEFANRTIQQIFDANLPERDGLETIIVYDEVHRLLEKFGGNGEGLKQLERGAREFRKWGVGMVLLSQVISDFSGEIRANIGTTIQMRTQYDDDLERIREKFGIDTVKSIAKAEVGSGMLQNSDYNHGRPYFVDFRPLLHSPHRLSDEELEKYEDYNKRVDAIEEKVDQLEEQGEDVYEYRSELKLTKRNLKKGSFSLVDTYIEELEEKLDI